MTCALRRKSAIRLSRRQTFKLLGPIEELALRQRPTLMLTDWRL
jgi:hypothetical protein